MYMKNLKKYKKIQKLEKEIIKLKKERNNEIFKARSRGLTHREIGNIFDISPEAVRKILLLKNNTKNNLVDKI